MELEFKKTITAFTFLITLFFNSQIVQAIPMLTMDSGLVTGISDLEVGSNLYNLSFVNGSVDSLYPSKDFSPVTTATLAENILSVMRDVLQVQLSPASDYNLQISSCGDVFSNICNFNLAYALEPGNNLRHLERYIGAEGNTFGSIQSWVALNDYDTGINATETMVVVTQASPVPVPGALVLFVTALLSLGLQRKKLRS